MLDIDDRNIEAYTGRAYALTVLDRYDKAMADFDTAIEIDAENPLIYARRAAFYRLQDDYETALADFTTAIEIDPEYTNAYKRRADVYAALGDEEQAIADWQMYFDVAEDLDDKVEAADELAAYDIAVEFPPLEIELETFEHPSGAFSVSVPVVETSDSSVDEANMGTLNTLVFYDSAPAEESLLRPLLLIVARVDARAADESLDDFDSQEIIRLMLGSDLNVTETLNEERLDDNRLLLELAVDDPSSPLNRVEILVEDSGDTRFMLFFTTNNFSVFEPTWAEISESYTFDPAAAAEALEAAGATQAEAEAEAEAAAPTEEGAEADGATGQAVPLQLFEHPSGAFSLKVPVGTEAMPSEISIDDPEIDGPHNMSTGYFNPESFFEFFVLMAAAGPSDTMFEGQSVDQVGEEIVGTLGLGDSEGVELIGQRELDDGSLLIELEQTDEETSVRMEIVVAEQGNAKFMLIFMTTNYDMFEATWLEILDSYTFNPEAVSAN